MLSRFGYPDLRALQSRGMGFNGILYVPAQELAAAGGKPDS
jgi:hypothetical protein